MSPSSSSTSCNWIYDVFPSFSGEDVRVTFLSHFLKELDRKLIITFKDNEIERSRSLDPELKQAIKESRIAVVIFSENYASSSWCLNELLEIVRCKKAFDQMVIPVFYGLDPSHVRKQTGEFGKIFEETCHNKTEQVKIQWREALTDVANILGYHSVTWGNEAKMIEEIANDVLDKLLLTPSKDSEEFVGIEDHIGNMSVLLQLESKEVMMVGIWGSSGIGKTTIARVLLNRLSRHFQGSVFIDRAFLSKSMEIYTRANPYDYNMKLHLQGNFLSEILGKKDVKIDHLGAIEEKLKHRKVLIFIDDLDDQGVLDALAGQTHWFGCGSRIIVVTNDKQFLRAHRIDHIYKVPLPSVKLGLEMFCRSAFWQNYPPDGFIELASEVALRAGNLPLGLNVLGSFLRGRDKEDWMDMLPSLRERLNGKIEKTLRVSYDGLNNKKDEALFRHIACLFNGEKLNDIKVLLADSDLDVNIGIKNLIDKSLIHVRKDTLEMHSLLQEMGKDIVRAQSKEPGEREFLVDSKDICNLLEDNVGTKMVLGISLDIDEIDELRIHKKAFKGMQNLRFLNIYTKTWDHNKEVRWHLPEGFNFLPHKLRLLRLDGYPMRCMPSNFRLENLVKLQMRDSKLEKLWEGAHSLSGLKHLDMLGSLNLREIPNLSMTTNLETLEFSACSSLVELPSSIQNLHKLIKLEMPFCYTLEILPTGINLQSLNRLNLNSCYMLRGFPDISTNISYLDISHTEIQKFPSNLRLENLVDLKMHGVSNDKLWERVQPLAPLMTTLSPSLTRLELSYLPSLVEIPSSLQNLNQLKDLHITKCINLVILPSGINLESLDLLDLRGCSRLKNFPDISTNIETLYLMQTGIEEVPWWIQNFSKLQYLDMSGCNSLSRVSLSNFKLRYLIFDFTYCRALTEVSWNYNPSELALATDNIHSQLSGEDFSSLPEDGRVELIFINCFNLDQEALLQQQPAFFPSMIFSGEQVPTCFTHLATSGSSLINIPLFQTSPSQPFLICRVCATGDVKSLFVVRSLSVQIIVCCRLIDRLGNHFDCFNWIHYIRMIKLGSHMVIFSCHFVLPQLHFDHVDVEFEIISDDSDFEIKGWGIQVLSEDCTPFSDNPNMAACVCEADESNEDSESEHGQACSDIGEAESESRQYEGTTQEATDLLYNQTHKGEYTLIKPASLGTYLDVQHFVRTGFFCRMKVAIFWLFCLLFCGFSVIQYFSASG
ncbi:hypothetical protein AALP_AA6G145800 [Arabis alpina]|uniref:ADP-ribosyl cyclase/cyclic ADP-ribose hydrolase n=1 Tax=Arabis alpina TaxID=50452 RepID=A0A087GP82_ARAAL|nr:hypothetical protein AALP_AA6G145800 [Arabis alpina]